jgi:hypothetical protein
VYGALTLYNYEQAMDPKYRTLTRTNPSSFSTAFFSRTFLTNKVPKDHKNKQGAGA